MIRIVYVERTARTGKHPHHFGRVNLGNRTLQRTKYPGNLVVRTSLQRIVNAAYHLLRNDVLLQRVEQGCAIAANHCQHMGNVAYLRVFLPEIPDTGVTCTFHSNISPCVNLKNLRFSDFTGALLSFIKK